MKFLRTFTFILIGITHLACAATSAYVADTKPYVMPTLLGQLGNQLFQIAAATSLALDHHAKVIVPDLQHSEQYDIPTNRLYVHWRVDASDKKARTRYVYQEPAFSYSPIPYIPNMEIRGYFTSEKYFIKHKAAIQKLFAPSSEINDYLLSKYDDIIYNPETVSIHVRTYLQNDPNHEAFYLNGREYVEKAMSFFPDNYTFIIFSDNIPWCKEHLNGLRPNMRYIEGEKHYHDFYLMSKCKHNIISNSTFSWWAAYLNMNPDKIVIAPKKWLTPKVGADCRDVIPESWISIE